MPSLQRLTGGAVLLLVMAALTLFATHAQSDDYGSGKAAAAFCATPDAKALTCGWASMQEEDASTGGMCIWCGTVWMGEPPLNLPANLSLFGRSYFQQAGHVISLGCQGQVVVRAVLKILQQPDEGQGNCSYARLEDVSDSSANASSVIRCELLLPPPSYNGETEVQRALRSQEVNCYKCGRCGAGFGCPNQVGVWYSDTFTTNVQGCNADFNTTGYLPRIPYIIINPDTSLTLAKFEVCNAPSCFNTTYEAEKAESAKVCVSGKCPD